MQIFKSEYRNGAWTYPSGISNHISRPEGGDCGKPHVAMDDNGNAIIVWQQDVGSSTAIFKSEYRNGLWTHPISLSDNISPDDEPYASFPKVAMDNHGNAIIVWEQYNVSWQMQIFKSEYRNGVWKHPSGPSDNISSVSGGEIPQVAMDNHGNAIIVWVAAGSLIYKSEYRNGAWMHPSNTVDHINPDYYNVYSTDIAMDDNGNAIIVWYQGVSLGPHNIYKSEFRAGAWTHPSSRWDYIDLGIRAWDPKVAMNNKGNAIITWWGYGGTTAKIFKSEYQNRNWSQTSSPSENINPAGNDAGYPEVALSNNGNGMIPDGHLKIPHPWPGQNPPPQGWQNVG